MDKKRVLLGMSGGVDSSVAALLLKNEGYEVVGTTLDLFCKDEELNESTINDAKRMCDCLELEHHAYDFKDEFKKKVIDDFIHCYASCKTPNPCIECNKYIKFGAMYKKAKRQSLSNREIQLLDELSAIEQAERILLTALEEAPLTDTEKGLAHCMMAGQTLSSYARTRGLYISHVYKIRDKMLKKMANCTRNDAK